CTLVPDPPDVLTSNAGWQVAAHEEFLREVLAKLREWGVRSSLFIDVFAWDAAEQEALLRLRPDRVELYTEKYAHSYDTPDEAPVTTRYREVGQSLHKEGIGLNAGHDLNLANIRHLLETIPQIEEVSIGHALIAESLYMGF